MINPSTEPVLSVIVPLPEKPLSRKAVFDAMVFLQAGANPTGPSGACSAYTRLGALALIELGCSATRAR